MIFYGLAPGRYAFQARGRDVYGSWGESEALSLVIVPPFWMRTWFRASVAILLVALALTLHQARQRTLKRRANEMLRLGVARERALESRLGNEAELAVLTPRQKEILQLIAEGQSTRDIAELLGVSMKTVQAHRANLMERLEIDDMAGLVRLAVRTGLVSSQS
jgi:DNA-binding NarL/FixJ family response regulator